MPDAFSLRATTLLDLRHLCGRCLLSWCVITGTPRPDTHCPFCHSRAVEVLDA